LNNDVCRWAGTAFNAKPLLKRQAERDAAVEEARKEVQAELVGAVAL
jgi:hypothetical protein